jgi:SAM-dependent methyltransferase
LNDRERRQPDASPPDAGEILRELCRLAQGGPASCIQQFRSVVGARQYLRLYALVDRYVPPPGPQGSGRLPEASGPHRTAPSPAPAGADVLDWGIGHGHFSYYLVRRGHRATGFSLDEPGGGDWLPFERFRFVQGDAAEPTRLPFGDASFDAVVSVGVLEHVRESGGTELGSLREIARILRPGGVFICYHFANKHSLIELVAKLIPGKPYHRYKFTRSDIRRLTSAADLELLESKRYGFLPRNFWRYLPESLRNSEMAGALWDGLDAALAFVLSPLCQNHLFVARRRM